MKNHPRLEQKTKVATLSCLGGSGGADLKVVGVKPSLGILAHPSENGFMEGKYHVFRR